jgi:hypothetical protein
MCLCLVSFIGLVIPSLQRMGILFTFIVLADLPISALAYAIGWKYGTLAAVWVLVAGTLWWYLLARGANFLIDVLHRRKMVTLFPSHRGHNS